MRLLDLFCGAGGAAMGYSRAGFDEIVGVDNVFQKHYPFEFVQADALEYVAEHGVEFDAIHASPPCQLHSTLKSMSNAGQHQDWVTPTVEALERMGKPYVVENVPGAPLSHPVRLCGTTFGLGVDWEGVGWLDLRRHRVFECSFPLLTPPCGHRKGVRKIIGVYGDHVRTKGHRDGDPSADISMLSDKLRMASTALDIDWMDWDAITQAIPPAYTEFIGKQLMAALA